MNIVCAPAGMVGRENPRQGVADIAAAGFRDMLLDMSLYCTPAELERNEAAVLQRKMCEETAGLRNQCRKNGMRTGVAYAPYLMRDAKCADTGKIMTHMSEISIKTAAQNGCRYIVVRPLYGGIAEKDLWKVNRKYYLKLAETAKEWNMMILLENQCKNKNGHLLRGVCSDAVCAAEWIDALNAYIVQELDYYKEAIDAMHDDRTADWGALNDVFIDVIW